MRLMLPFAACLALSLSELPRPRLAAAVPPAPVAASPLTPPPKGPTTYYFGAHTSRTRVTFESKTNVTNIFGQSNLCSGSATVDFDAKSGSCHLVIPSASLNSGMDDRDRAMYGKAWLDVKTHPTIEFKSTQAAFLQGNAWTIKGDFLFRGVSKELSVEADVRQVPASIGQKLGEGAWIRVKTGFKVDIREHGITIDKSAQFTVEPIWTINVELFATTAKPADVPAPVAAPEEEEIKIVRVPKLPSDGLPGAKYEFGKKVQLTTLVATSRTQIETILTTCTSIHGFIGYDKEGGLAATRLHIPVAQLKTGDKARDEHLRSAGWLDEKSHKMIAFESRKTSKKDAKTWSVEGTFTLKGVPKPLTLDVTVQEIPAETMKAANWGDKPGLRVEGDFQVKLSDFGVKISEPATGKVNDTLDVHVFLIALLSDEK